jgi:hypothetical protein
VLDSASPSTGGRRTTVRIRIEDLGRLASIPEVTCIALTWADTQQFLNYSAPEIGVTPRPCRWGKSLAESEPPPWVDGMASTRSWPR